MPAIASTAAVVSASGRTPPILKGEVTGSARGTQEKERGATAWANVNAEVKFVHGVDALWGKRDEEVALGGCRVVRGRQRSVRTGKFRAGRGKREGQLQRGIFARGELGHCGGLFSKFFE